MQIVLQQQTTNDIYDFEYQNILNAMDYYGYTKPSRQCRRFQNEMLEKFKADGIWSLLDELYIGQSDGSLSSKSLNWKQPIDKYTYLGTPFVNSANNKLEAVSADGFLGLQSPYSYGGDLKRNITKDNSSMGYVLEGFVQIRPFDVKNDLSEAYIYPREMSNYIRMYYNNTSFVSIASTTLYADTFRIFTRNLDVVSHYNSGVFRNSYNQTSQELPNTVTQMMTGDRVTGKMSLLFMGQLMNAQHVEDFNNTFMTYRNKFENL